MRRSLLSRLRAISPRFSRRSSRRVTSGSRVIIRPAISPHARPSGAPRRIRSTLYWWGERSALFNTTARWRDSRSQVWSRSRNALSSGEPIAVFSECRRAAIELHYSRYHDYCHDDIAATIRGSRKAQVEWNRKVPGTDGLLAMNFGRVRPARPLYLVSGGRAEVFGARLEGLGTRPGRARHLRRGVLVEGEVHFRVPTGAVPKKIASLLSTRY